MFDYFDKKAEKIIAQAKKLSLSLKQKIVGSESLLLSFLENNVEINSLKNKSKEIIEIIKNLTIIRDGLNEDEYTQKFIDIINVAYDISFDEEESVVLKEHLLYAMCSVKDTIAYDILKRVNIDIEHLLEDIVLKFPEKEKDNILLNLTKKVQKTKKSLIGREEEVKRIIRIIKKKQKNNPLLIGSEGVGKSILVEGVAKELLKQNIKITVYQLDIALLLSGTKYRGDLEERIMEIATKLKNKNHLLFIDEIHTITSQNSSEGTLDIANILKPLLSRGELHIIGATTLDEYYKYIQKDRALARRFQQVFIDEADETETYFILKGIKGKYEKFHKFKCSDEILKEITKISSIIKNRKMPDKAIDILDESFLLSKDHNKKEVMKEDVYTVAFEMLGINYSKALEAISGELFFPSLKRFYFSYLNNLKLRNNIMSISFSNDEELKLIISDLKKVFNIKDEAFLKIDLEKYSDQTAKFNLLGSAPGYVGYDNGGVISEHVIRYPINVLIIDSINNTSTYTYQIIKTIVLEGKIRDGKGREIDFSNTVFCFKDEEKENVGFLKQSKMMKLSEEKIRLNKSISYKNETMKLLKEINSLGSKYLLKMKDVNYDDYEDIKRLIKENFDFQNQEFEIIKEEDEIKILKK